MYLVLKLECEHYGGCRRFWNVSLSAVVAEPTHEPSVPAVWNLMRHPTLRVHPDSDGHDLNLSGKLAKA